MELNLTQLDQFAKTLVQDLENQLAGHKASVIKFEGAIEGVKLFMQELVKLEQLKSTGATKSSEESN